MWKRKLFNWVILGAFVLSMASALVPHAQAYDHADHMVTGMSDHAMTQKSAPCPVADFHCMVFGGGCAPLAMNAVTVTVVKVSNGEAAFFLQEKHLQGRSPSSDPRPPRT